jgi:hypothetical protein
MNDIQIPVGKQLPTKKRGGQITPLLVKARNMLWCIGVKELTAIENPQMDKMFVWKNAGDHLKHAPAKVFERIEKTGMCPRGKGTGLKRSLAEIVEAVDQHPDFRGTAIVFNSKLWELLELKSIDRADILSRIDGVFMDHGVQRYELPEREESWRLRRNPDLDIQCPINPIELINLQKANLHKITLEYLMILLYLFAKTIPLQDQKRVFEINVTPLGKYFEEKLGKFGSECAAEAFKRIQAIKVMRLF